jgi:hypothetical protein
LEQGQPRAVENALNSAEEQAIVTFVVTTMAQEAQD